MDKRNNAFKKLANRAYFEFGDVCDFVWKSPRLIETETELEKNKIRSYFPLSKGKEKDHLAIIGVRWALEHNKLVNVFPRLIAVGNLFNSVSLFEVFCLSLCRELERATGKRLLDSKGRGISKIFNFLQRTNIDLECVPLREQARAAFVLRNCLIHAGGQLAWSRDASDVKAIVKRSSHLSKDHQARQKKSKDFPRTALIVKSDFGEELHITNDYAFILTGYLRDHFCELCKHAQVVHGGQEVTLP
jgi:hypothetical protein